MSTRICAVIVKNDPTCSQHLVQPQPFKENVRRPRRPQINGLRNRSLSFDVKTITLTVDRLRCRRLTYIYSLLIDLYGIVLESGNERYRNTSFTEYRQPKRRKTAFRRAK